MWKHELFTITFLTTVIYQMEADYVPIFGRCRQSYLEGSVGTPCGYCWICMKEFISLTTKQDCSITLFLKSVHPELWPFEIITNYHLKALFCFGRLSCGSLCKCEMGRDSVVNIGKKACINLFGSCKCVCPEDRYGQVCEHKIPAGFSTESFADLKNIIYPAYVYSSDFANFTLFFHKTGINLSVEVQTDRELLTYNSGFCKTDFSRSVDYCQSIYEDVGISNFKHVCEGGSSFYGTTNNVSCHMTLYLAFPRIHYYAAFPDDILNDFIVDYLSSPDFPNRTIVAHREIVEIRVYNTISIENQSLKQLIYQHKYGLMSIYKGKTFDSNCPPRLIIENHAKSMFQAPHFSRKNKITITSTVNLNNQTSCTHVGGPVFSWFVWLMYVNHDEKDAPFFKKLATTSQLVIQEFSLDFGLYKVKCHVSLAKGGRNTETTYTYFKIVRISLDPNIIGGDLRYVYYKTNFELMSGNAFDPNFPSNKQPKIKYTWSCNDTEHFCRKVTTHSLTVFGPFKINKYYKFTMKSESLHSTLEEYDTQTIAIVQDLIPGLLIYCLKNCGGRNFKSDPRQIIYFKVGYSQFSPRIDKASVFNWTCFKGKDRQICDIQKTRQPGIIPSLIFIVNYDTLESNDIYSFRVVSGGSKNQGCAEITIHTSKTAKKFNCSVEPSQGTVGETRFSIKCFISDDVAEDTSLTYTFYDLYNETDVMGRVLGFSYIGELDEVILTRGTIGIQASDDRGHYHETFVKVSNLSREGLSLDFLENIHVLRDSVVHRESQNKISFISGLADLLNDNQTQKEAAIDICLEILKRERVSNLMEAQLLLTTTQNVICYEDDCKLDSISDISYENLNQILSAVSLTLFKELKMYETSSELHFPLIHSLYRTFLKCADVMMRVRDENNANKTHSQIDFKTYKQYKIGSTKIMRNIVRLNEALSIVNLPYVKSYSVLTENIKLWIKQDDPFQITSEILENFGKPFIKFSPQLTKYLKSISMTIAGQVMEFKTDPFWWSDTEPVSTEIVSISLGYINNQTCYKSFNRFKYPIDIFLKKLNYSNVTLTGEVTQPDPTASYDVKNTAVSIVKLHPSSRSSMSLKFIDLNQDDEFKVLLLLNLRPDYELVLSDGIIISNTTPIYHSTKQTKTYDDFIYVGILPGNSIPTGKSLRYKFQLESARCQSWHDSIWVTTGCNLGFESTADLLHCQCNHLSFLSGYLSVPTNLPVPFVDYKLFLNLPENPLVFLLITIILILYLVLLVLASIKDKKNNLKNKLIVLEDNVSTDKFGYLVIVFSGSRLCAGTTSNIGIMIQGTEHNSRAHVLRSPLRRTLQRGYDDWFLMFTPWYLGEVTFLHLWSDHSGPKPNWFCSRVVIHDLHSKTDYTFMIGQWFGVTQLGIRVQLFSLPVKVDAENKFYEFFVTNLNDGFRESHLLFSIVFHHPRSQVYGTQRLSMMVVGLLASLLSSIMFYNVALPHEEDQYIYGISRLEVLISIYSLAICVIVTGFVYLIFKLSNKGEDIMGYRSSELHVDRIEDSRPKKKSRHNCNYYFMKTIFSIRKEEFRPVLSTGGNKSSFGRCSLGKILAWGVCFTIIFITSYLIILTGLKLGRVKSLLWLTSIGMAIGTDSFIVDPGKIIFISIIFCLAQAQFCRLYVFDRQVNKLLKENTRKINVKQDSFIHNMRMRKMYRYMSVQRMNIIFQQKYKIQRWWLVLDFLDIGFLFMALFHVISLVMAGEYYYSSNIPDVVLRNISLEASQDLMNMSYYSEFLQSNIYPILYSTEWYNGRSLTADSELFAETGWTLDATHRLVGVPRLRQIRTKKERCLIPRVLRNLTVYCNVKYSWSTEDTYDYGTHWGVISWDDIMFETSLWTYSNPDLSSFYTMRSDSGEWFHGGGYISELGRTQKQSFNKLLHLINAEWIDKRTRIVFFEMTTYNVNKNVFNSIMFITEHLESTLTVTGKRTWSVTFQEESSLIKLGFVMYTVMEVIKLLMLINNGGLYLFCNSFWAVYDLNLILIGFVCFAVYREVSMTTLKYTNDFQRHGQEGVFTQFDTLKLYFIIETIILGVLFLLTSVRVLRLFKSGNMSTVSEKQRYTLNLSWPKIMWMTLVLVIFLFSLQRLLLYSLNCTYPMEVSHLMSYKKKLQIYLYK